MWPPSDPRTRDSRLEQVAPLTSDWLFGLPLSGYTPIVWSKRLPDPVESLSVIARIKEQIRILVEEQSRALQLAIYVGMSTSDTKAYDERRERISTLSRELQRMQANESSAAQP